jgi:AcrR family transcriptional regulator
LCFIEGKNFPEVLVMAYKYEENRRVRRTKRIMKEAFVMLVQEKGYSNVSVKDIVERADYNRSSFYHYYTSKEALTEELIGEIIEGYKQASRMSYKQSNGLNLDTFPASSIELFTYIYEHALYYRLLIATEPIPGLQNKLIDTIHQLLHEEIIFISDQDVDSNGEHFITFRTYGIFGLIIEWIKSDFECSPTDIAKQLIEILKTNASSIHFQGSKDGGVSVSTLM